MNKKNYAATLVGQSRQIFHTQDLRVVWGMPSNNTLYTTVKRYIDRGLLHPLQKGLYSTVPTQQLDPWLIGLMAIHGFGYVSCEIVLAQHGFLSQPIHTITLVSSMTRQFTLAERHYTVRQMQDHFLYHPYGVSVINNVRQADLNRAISDQLYFQPHTHFDVPVDWARVRTAQKIIGYPVTTRV